MNNYVRTLFEDNHGRLFVGSLNGLQIYDRATDQFATVPMRFVNGEHADPNVSTVFERKNGDILIGTAGHSLFILETQGDTIKARQINRLVSSNLITCLYEDRERNLWVATGDNGIFRVDGTEQVRHYSNGNSVALNTISSICEDDHGHLYICLLYTSPSPRDTR